MAFQLHCPACRRRLPEPTGPGLVACDGCGHRFDPWKLRLVQAPAWKRIVGTCLLILGGLSVPVAVIQVRNAEQADESERYGYYVGSFLVPFVCLLTGWRLTQSRLVEDPPTDGVE